MILGVDVQFGLVVSGKAEYKLPGQSIKTKKYKEPYSTAYKVKQGDRNAEES